MPIRDAANSKTGVNHRSKLGEAPFVNLFAYAPENRDALLRLLQGEQRKSLGGFGRHAVDGTEAETDRFLGLVDGALEIEAIRACVGKTIKT